MRRCRAGLRTYGPIVTLWVALASSGGANGQTTGLVPLSDLGSGTYQGYTGGLYPGGSNMPPAAHAQAASAAAAEIVPRDAAGASDPAGWIVMVAIGMSNTTHEFAVFEREEDANPGRNARVVLMDTGLGGQTATAIANPNAGYWTTLQRRLDAMGLSAAQVQVAWMKEAEAFPPDNFPLHAQALSETLAVVANNLHDKFPNLKLCYVSSRIYGGYAAPGSLNPEPQAYESGFAVQWLIERQIGGDPDLNYGQLPGPVQSPLLLWGPYLWADGTNPRSDGLVWLLDDFEGDRTHPSPAGEAKVAGHLSAFFAADPSAGAWWPEQPGATLVTVDAAGDAYVSAGNPATNYGAAPLLAAQGGAAPLDIFLEFDVAAVQRPVLLAKLGLRVNQSGGGWVSRVEDTTWDEGTLTYQNAPPIGTALVQMPQSSRDGTIAAAVTAAVNGDADAQLTFALTTTTQGQVNYHSREAHQPPRLVLVVESPPSAAGEAAPGEGSALALRASAPNPFGHTTALTYALPRAGRAVLTVHDARGRAVATLVDRMQPAGEHTASWTGRDDRGRALAPGIYFARLASGGDERTVKLTLAR